MRPLRRIVDAVSWVLSPFALIACGMSSFKHTVEVVVVDPSRRLGSPPYDVSVFDPRMGSTSDWAKRWMGPTSDSAHYKVEYAQTAMSTAFGPPRPDKVDMGLAVPGYDSRGLFFVSVEPAKTRSGKVRAAFTPYSDNFKEQAPRLDVEYTATPEPQGWHLLLRLLIPPNDSAR